MAAIDLVIHDSDAAYSVYACTDMASLLTDGQEWQ